MNPQLLTVIEKEALQKWTPSEWAKWQIEPKRDGFRMMIVGGKVESRSGKPLHNFSHIQAELLSQLPLHNIVLDGEFHGDTWEETSHVARASKSERSTKLTYTIFDMLTITEWREQRCFRPLSERQDAIRKHIKETEHVKFVQPITISDGFRGFSIIHKYHLDTGCDGTVLKRKDSLYEFKRTRTWLKVKPVLDCNCLVVGMTEGTGKYKGMLGALEVLPENAKKEHTGVFTRVSGMTDEQRREWWGPSGPRIIGKWIEVSYRKVNPSGRLVEPRFVRIRTDLI